MTHTDKVHDSSESGRGTVTVTAKFLDPGRTAISRKKPSLPTRTFIDRGVLKGRILDYGCGKGADVRYLRGQGCDIVGYDPHHAPEGEKYLHDNTYDTVVCNYVLNVVSAHTCKSIVADILRVLKPGGVAYITVRDDLKSDTSTQRRVFLSKDLHGTTLSGNVHKGERGWLERKGSFRTYIVTK